MGQRGPVGGLAARPARSHRKRRLVGPSPYPCRRNYAKFQMLAPSHQRWSQCECPVWTAGRQQDSASHLIRIWTRSKCRRAFGIWCLPHSSRLERIHGIRFGREIRAYGRFGFAEASSRLVSLSSFHHHHWPPTCTSHAMQSLRGDSSHEDIRLWVTGGACPFCRFIIVPIPVTPLGFPRNLEEGINNECMCSIPRTVVRGQRRSRHAIKTF